MKKFLFRFFIFAFPILLSAVLIEIWARNNTYQAKATYLQEHLSEIQLMVLGTSQSQSAIHPALLEVKMASLSHAGSTPNIESLLFDKFFPQLPRLKYVMFELAPYTLETWTSRNSSQNHLFWMYYGINNYQGNPPLKDYFLLTANPKAHIGNLFSFKVKSPFDEFGFITQAPFTLADSNKEKEILIQQVKSEKQLKAHQVDRLKWYKRNTALLDEKIQWCLNNNVKVILFSPPLFKPYKEIAYQLNPAKCKRRDAYVKKWKDQTGVYIWNWEDLYPTKKENFVNGNHVSTQGAAELTKLMNSKLKEL